MQVKLPVLSKENCQVMYYPSMQFCAGDNNIDKDTCEVNLCFGLLIGLLGIKRKKVNRENYMFN